MARKSAFAASVITDQTFNETPEEKTCPYELEYIWTWFCELDKTRTNGMTVGAITHNEITKFSEGMNYGIIPFERRALRALDDAYIKFQNTKSKEKK